MSCQEEDYRKLVYFVLLNSCSHKDIGLLYGKAGLSISLFETSHFLRDEQIENYAFDLIQQALV
ncbi:hypothetical protein GCM10023231_28290 [Olivibacter ginsenosidimutans]|uniref:DUF3791 domain-containing protein n=1 Tax=Olivibacter ginsenosidimutans TaxID=1176537 RepID=A0ABP9BSD0_9SPHI